MAKIISIFSAKGGVGRTFITTNLAVCLARKLSGKKVLILDADFQLPGDIARLMDLQPRKALTYLASGWQDIKSLYPEIRDCIIQHRASKLDFLSCVLSPRESVLIDENFLSRVLEELNSQYDLIIIDAGRNFTRRVISIFEQTNLILFAVNPDVLSVYQTKQSLETLESMYFPLRMVKLVLNRAESMGGVGWREVKGALPCDIIARIPSEGKVVGSAMNRRIPVVLDSPRCRASVWLDKLAGDLLERDDFYISHKELSAVFAEHPTAKQSESLQGEEEGAAVADEDIGKAILSKKLATPEEKLDALKQRVHKHIIQKLDLRRMDNLVGGKKDSKNLRDKTRKVINDSLTEELGVLVYSREQREALVKEILDEALGLGPLEDLISDPTISDIMVNNKGQIYIEKHGRLEKSPKRFVSNSQVRQIIERIVAPLGRRVDESVPMVDGRLADGSRVNAIIPPLALTGPTLTIRKFGRERLTIPDLEKFNAIDETMATFIKACVLARKNIIVSGGTGSGKTTVLNVLSEFIPDGERIITIEDAAELKLHHEHWVRLESKPPNIEGKGSITVRELFRNTLRMRPDRIVIGECRGPETLDMLQAMNTGHNGSMTTIHANSTHDVLSRLDSLILMSGIEIPLRAIREMISSAIDIIVHTARLSDGSRKVMRVTELTGMTDDVHIGLQDIFAFSQASIDDQGKVLGSFGPTGFVPTFLEEIHRQGIDFPEDTFSLPK